MCPQKECQWLQLQLWLGEAKFFSHTILRLESLSNFSHCGHFITGTKVLYVRHDTYVQQKQNLTASIYYYHCHLHSSNWWRGCSADGVGNQGVAIPQRWVQILAKSAKRLPSYGRGVGGWGRGQIYFYVAFSHFSLFTSRALEMAS
jgi:hypothetical protein